MKTKSQTVGRKGSYGPNIVRAWFDTVFLYALRGLDSERDFLTKRNWTFRFHTRTLEYLGPLAEHLPVAARENLEQFVSFFPQIGTKISGHDICEHQLEVNCRAYLAALLEFEDFQKTFQSVASEAPHALGRDFSSHFGASPEADFMAILAEYLINNIEGLPSAYSTAELWNRYRLRFLPVVSGPGLAPFREATERSGRAMLDVVEELTSLFKDARSELSLRFDVPYVSEINSVR